MYYLEVYILLRPFLCFTTNQIAQKLIFLANLITYFVNMCNIYLVNHLVNPCSGQCDYFPLVPT